MSKHPKLNTGQSKDGSEFELANKAILDKPLFNPDEVVHAYVPPPVVNLQDVVKVPGRKPLPAELESYQKAEQETRAQDVLSIAEDFKHSIKPGKAGPSLEDEQRARALSVDFIKAQLNKQKKPETREEVADREARSHQESLDLIKAEMAATITTADYTG